VHHDERVRPLSSAPEVHEIGRVHFRWLGLGSGTGSVIDWEMSISWVPTMAMIIPVRVQVFVFSIICLMCSFAVCSEMPMAWAISLLVEPLKSPSTVVVSLGLRRNAASLLRDVRVMITSRVRRILRSAAWPLAGKPIPATKMRPSWPSITRLRRNASQSLRSLRESSDFAISFTSLTIGSGNVLPRSPAATRICWHSSAARLSIKRIRPRAVIRRMPCPDLCSARRWVSSEY